MDLLLDRLSRALLAVSLLAGFAMMLHVTAEVVARTAFRAPIPGTYETVAAYYMIAATFLPWAWLARRDQHISAEIFTEMMPARVQRILGVVTLILTILWMAVFTWQAVVSADKRLAQREVVETSAGYLAVWPSRWLLPVAGAAMLAVLVLRLVAEIRGRPHGDGGSSD